MATVTLLDTPCIEWHKARNTAGYGVTWIAERKKTVLVHRKAMMDKLGRDLEQGEIVCHRCDNPACYNVDHLFLGTHADNVRDKVAKGRQLKGMSVPSAKLSVEDKRRIVRMRNAGYISRVIAERHGVSRSIITKVIAASRRVSLEG